jgi:hypothetical protein
MNFRSSSPAALALTGTSCRGSVLMVALILAAVIAISLTSFLRLASNTAKLSNRSFYMDAAQNLCDLGMEQALWSMNNSGNWTGGNFSAVSGSSSKYVATFPTATTYYSFSGGVKGQVKVYADTTDSAKPHVVVQSIVTLNDGSTLTKEAEAYMKISSYFDNGMVGDTITFKGKVTVNSWNSDPNGDGSSIIKYSGGVARDNGQVGATAVQSSALFDGQGTIKGYASVGSADASGINVGSQGAIGDNAWIAAGNKGIESGHATYDFTASFPDVSAPTPPGGGSYVTLTATNIELPRKDGSGHVIDTPASDGKYYYQVSSISLGGNTDTMTINGDVVIKTTNTTGTTVDATGNHSGMVINSSGSLAIYTAGDVAVTGNGILNGTNSSDLTTSNQPVKFQLYGTRSSATASTSGEQSFAVKGNGYLSGVVYAPNANVTVNGNGDVLGAVVGNTVTMTGNAAFHFDESLGNFGSAGLWKIRKWRELATVSERATYDSVFTF